MICEVRENGKEVVLREAKLADVFALLTLCFFKGKELAFTRPTEEE